ncbi:SRPBCC family protein [Nonomuraea sp. SMC257]|uniref:SRPBCC family protein n=1 Tax=Nonomuraea montanisoli TaxID=2741721 RepID=A0A7Y6I8N0_9ACTN|nr:SRPBCC family protein [Nonomuraea montanisoli]NUW32364.1 SRPBCC family protein [Nonomuraea montanisoli]
MSEFTRRAGRSAALFAIPLAMAGTLAVASPSSAAAGHARNAAAERPHPAPLTCGGQSVDPAAKIRYRTETLIKAPLRTIWKLQTDVERWPSWQPPVASAKRLDSGKLRPGSRFRWTTPVPETATTPATTLVITSTVRQAEENQCIRWTGPAIGDGLRIDRGVHVWNFTKVKGGVLVRTEETWTGAQVEADVPTSTGYLGAGLEAWLTDLKTTAEAGHDGGLA